MAPSPLPTNLTQRPGADDAPKASPAPSYSAQRVVQLGPKIGRHARTSTCILAHVSLLMINGAHDDERGDEDDRLDFEDLQVAATCVLDHR